MSSEATYQKALSGMTREQRRRHRAGALYVAVPMAPIPGDDFARHVEAERQALLAAFALPPEFTPEGR